MPEYPNSPGVRVRTLDGGLDIAPKPKSKSTLVVGTSGKGPANKTVNVTDTALITEMFGTDGTLIKAMYEVLMHSDNVKLFRMGTAPAVLDGVGKADAVNGFKITLGERSADASTIYKIWYKDGALYLYKNDALVYAKDDVAKVAIDTGDSVVEGTAVAGLDLCKSALAPTLENALTLDAASKLAAVDTDLPPTFTAAVTGLGLDLCETYEALDTALDLLQIENVDNVICPNAVLDAPNVAFYVAADPTTAKNNPATSDALGWLKTTVDDFGVKTYSWAHIAGTVFADAADRLNKGYHEVCFGYLLAKFASLQQAELGGCIAGIATNGPKFYNNATIDKFDLVSLRNWIGKLPKYDSAGRPTANGTGVLGIPYLVGCTAAKLNSLCAEYATGQGYRLPGFFENDLGEYDGGVNYDKNGKPIDIGAYLLPWTDTQFISNRFAYQYAGNLVAVVIGYLASLDEKRALTFKTLNGVTQVWYANFGIMEAMAKAKLGVLRGDEATPTIMHDNSAALPASDWSQIYRTRLKFLVSKIAFTTGKKFLGENSINGLQLTSMKTALDSDADELKKRGYISGADFDPHTDAADARIGKVTLDIQFWAPDQARMLETSIGIVRR